MELFDPIRQQPDRSHMKENSCGKTGKGSRLSQITLMPNTRGPKFALRQASTDCVNDLSSGDQLIHELTTDGAGRSCHTASRNSRRLNWPHVRDATILELLLISYAAIKR
jgi:hypothetical protein